MNMKTRLSLQTGLLALALGVFPARADVTPNPLFADNAVLQQGMKVPVWGMAEPGEPVTVEFAGQSVSTTADAAGKWLVQLAPMKAGSRPRTLTISGKNKIVLTNILVGEVWICSGQSNMERQLGLRDGQKPITDWQKEVADAKYPEIRQFYVPQTRAFAPAQTVPGSWAVCSPGDGDQLHRRRLFLRTRSLSRPPRAHRVDPHFLGRHGGRSLDQRDGFEPTAGFYRCAGAG